MDPLTITTSIITLTKTLHSFTRLITDYAYADTTVADIRSTCELACFVLANINEQLDSNLQPALLVQTAEGISTGTRAGVDLAEVLRNNVSQLQLDVDVLVKEVQNLFDPNRPGSRVGEWVSSGVLVWKKSYLEGMHTRIQSKLTQLQLVQTNLHAQANTIALNQHGSHDSVLDALGQLFKTKRRSSVNPYARQRLIKAVRERDGHSAEELLQQIDPNFASDNMEKLYPLHIAAKNSDMAMINLLLDHGAKVDCYHGKQTPLMLALDNKDVAPALTLIGRGANVSQADSRGRTALHIAARRNHYAVVQVLLGNGVDLNVRDIDGRTPLLECVDSEQRHLVPDDVSLLRVLLEREINGLRADPSLGRFKDRFNPLHLAAQEGYIKDLEILAEAARSRRIDLDSEATLDHMGRAPLWYAASRGHVEAVKILIRFGANVNRLSERDTERPTALWAMATFKGCEDSVTGLLALLNAGANPDIGRNTKGHTLLIAASNIGNASLTKLLLRHGADPNLEDKQGMQPIHYAARNGDQESVSLLLKSELYRVDINCTNKEGATPLILAAMNGHDYLVKFLERYEPKRADWRHTDKFGSDAFYLACATGHTFCAAYLHVLGADLNKTNNNLNTPLHVAARGGHYDTVLWLLRMGADKNARSRSPSGDMVTPDEIAKTAIEDKAKAETIASLIKNWTPERARVVRWTVNATWVEI